MRISTTLDAVAVMTWRSARHALRSPDALIVTAALPVALLLLMTVVFGRVIAPQLGSYTDYVTPGVIALCVGYGASQAALSVAIDARDGVIDRYRTMDIPPAAPILGHIIVAAAKNLIAVALVLATAAALGANLTVSPPGVAALVLIVVGFTLATATLAATVGLSVSAPEAAAGLSFVMLFLPYTSSAFVPVDALPQWLQAFGHAQPFTPLSETIRGLLFAGHSATDAPALLAWTVGILTISGLALLAIWRRRAR